jgi:hypothetical protein
VCVSDIFVLVDLELGDAAICSVRDDDDEATKLSTEQLVLLHVVENLRCIA